MKLVRIPHYLGCIFIDDGNEALLDLLIFVQHLQVFRNLQKIFRVVIGICIRPLLAFIEIHHSALIDTRVGKLDNGLRENRMDLRCHLKDMSLPGGGATIHELLSGLLVISLQLQNMQEASSHNCQGWLVTDFYCCLLQ